MEYNEDRDSLKNIPTYTLPSPPRFDAAASAAARPVEPLAKRRILPGLYVKPKFSRLINRRVKWLALMAIIGLATGATGGILVVERNKQQQSDNSFSMVQVSSEQTSTSDSATPAVENTDSSLEIAEPAENTVRVRPTQRRPRKRPASELVVLSNTEEDEDLDRDKDDDEDKDKNDDDREKDRERDRNRKNREDDGDAYRSGRIRQRTVLHDVMRVRKP